MATGSRTYVDGNRNGVLTRDIARGIDLPITAVERLDYHLAGVEFGIHPNVTGIDPGPFNTSDPIQIGSSTLLSFSPDRSVDVRDAVSAWPSRPSVRCPGMGAQGGRASSSSTSNAGTWLAR